LQASLFALIQLALVANVGHLDCDIIPTPNGCHPHLHLLRNISIFFAYTALSADTSGALSALLIARTLFGVANVAQDLLDEKRTLDTFIFQQMSILEPKLGLDHHRTPRSRTQERKKAYGEFKVCHEEAERLFGRVERHKHIMKKHTGGQSGVISFIVFGILFFFVALLFQVVVEVVTSQLAGLWITLIVCVAVMGGVLVWREKRAHPRLWDALGHAHGDEKLAIGASNSLTAEELNLNDKQKQGNSTGPPFTKTDLTLAIIRSERCPPLL
jgi:hypothetical protein